MATQEQSSYINDLAVMKLKEFKEFKELIFSREIASENAELIKNAKSVAEITNYLTDWQSSKLITALQDLPEPKRGEIYGKNRLNEMISALEDIKNIIDDWSFR